MSTTTIGHFIAGHVEPGTGERTGPVYNPSTGEEIARCDYANRALLDRAVAVATEAGKKWGRASHAARQAVLLAEVVVIQIMRRRHLERTGSEFHIDVVIENDGDAAVDERHKGVAAF